VVPERGGAPRSYVPGDFSQVVTPNMSPVRNRSAHQQPRCEWTVLRRVNRLERAEVPEPLCAPGVVADVEPLSVSFPIWATQGASRGCLGASVVGIGTLGAISISAAGLVLLAVVWSKPTPFTIVGGSSVIAGVVAVVVEVVVVEVVVINPPPVARIATVPAGANVRSGRSAAGRRVTGGSVVLHGLQPGRLGPGGPARNTADLLGVDHIDDDFGRFGGLGGRRSTGILKAQRG